MGQVYADTMHLLTVEIIQLTILTIQADLQKVFLVFGRHLCGD